MSEIIERILASMIVIVLMGVVFYLASDVMFFTMQGPEIQCTPAVSRNLWWLWFIVIAWAVITSANLVATLISYGGMFAIPGWDALRSLSRNDAFKLSYVALILIPVTIYAIKLGLFPLESIEALGKVGKSIQQHTNGLPASGAGPLLLPKSGPFVIPLNAKLSYFSAFFFAVAVIINGFANPIAETAAVSAPEPSRPIADILWRWACYTTFSYGIIFLLIVLFRTAVYIVAA
jgi:hypothetical protein